MKLLQYTHLADHVLRRGWVVRGIKNPETVGEHMRECMKIAEKFADQFGVDCEKIVAMLAVHDVPEIDPEVGDIIPTDGVSKTEKLDRERTAMRKICARVSDGPEMLLLWEEFERGETPEAVIAKQIDAYQMLLQARRYQREQGLDIQEFENDVHRRVTHPVLKKLLNDMV